MEERGTACGRRLLIQRLDFENGLSDGLLGVGNHISLNFGNILIFFLDIPGSFIIVFNLFIAYLVEV